jgi:hypothetical protein
VFAKHVKRQIELQEPKYAQVTVFPLILSALTNRNHKTSLERCVQARALPLLLQLLAERVVRNNDSPYFYVRRCPSLDKIQDKRVSCALFDIIQFAY